MDRKYRQKLSFSLVQNGSVELEKVLKIYFFSKLFLYLNENLHQKG
ncbi:hypothetical protein SAMD00020551_0676 [Mesobacillus selenatarsenatis SF-1]|uniref:Uncharacterized protein n=1 Tax=Mesobacillus selenatarsenatis (strain DSM 18680 / JCM 14380 / FERM P-15431 / SF-1) TaxID=1321606 RepID=A0A0A8X321_MESS1|nr:hypothetical protein SAMD00020551_0676 [Mesobacillus selenatarsenatis SF-1]